MVAGAQILEFPEPPSPRDTRDLARWQHTRLRRRMLYGCWAKDLDARLKTEIGHIRKEAWGNPDLSSNVFRSAVSGLAVLYDRAPKATHNDEAGKGVIEQAEATGLWSLMQRVQRDTIGMREMFLRVEVATDGALNIRPAFPDMVLAWARADRPERPVELREAILRTRANGDQVWTFEVFDIRNPQAPRYAILDADGKDVSPEFLQVNGIAAPAGGLVGDAYPFRKRDQAKTPVIPYVCYHAAKTGQLFDAFEASELVEGSLIVAVLWTFFTHCVKNASWPQRYIIGAKLAGALLEGSQGHEREAVVTDPAVVQPLEPDPDFTGTPTAGQWVVAADPDKLAGAIGMYERRVAAYAGISPSDVQRVAGDPRSGYALAINREAQREAQRRYAPQFATSDEELLALCAILLNCADGGSRPEDGYRVAYESLPPSAEERQSEREHLLSLIGAGLLDKISAYQQLHPGISDEDAVAALERIATVNATVGTGGSGSGGGGAAQDSALNGAQIDALLRITTAIAMRQLPRDAGEAIVMRAFGSSADDAKRLLGTVGTSFFIEQPAAAAA